MERVKSKAWLSLAAIFITGALAVNAFWVYYYNKIDIRHVESIQNIVNTYDKRIAQIRIGYDERIEKMEDSHKRQMGAMRNRIEKKVDSVLEKLDKLPSTPIVIDARNEIERVKND